MEEQFEDEPQVAKIDWDQWSAERRRLGQESEVDYEGSRAKQKKALGTLALEIANRPDHDWKTEAAELDITVPNSNHPHMAATASTFLSSAISEHAKKQRSADLDRKALVVGFLVTAIQKDPAKYTVSQEGVDNVCAFINEQGGVTELSKKQRAINIAAKDGSSGSERDADIIDLDRDAVRHTAIERAKRDVGGESGQVRIALVIDDGRNTKVGMTLPDDDEAITAALLKVNAVDPLIDQVGELLQVGTMIAEEKSAALKDMHDDPENPAGGHRHATRHFVFEDRRTVAITTILNSSSVVVRAVAKRSLFADELPGPCHFRTRERRKLEMNIVDPARRPAFSGRFDGPGDTMGVCYFTASTDALVDNGDAGETKSVSVLIEPLKGTMPIKVDLSRFDPACSGEVSLSTWKTMHADFIAKYTKKNGNEARERQRHRFSEGTWKIAAKKNDRETSCAITGVPTDVEVMSGDFRHVSEVVAAMPIVGLITVKAERHIGLVISFATRNFDYTVYIPALTTSNARTTALVTHYKVATEA